MEIDNTQALLSLGKLLLFRLKGKSIEGKRKSVKSVIKVK